MLFFCWSKWEGQDFRKDNTPKKPQPSPAHPIKNVPSLRLHFVAEVHFTGTGTELLTTSTPKCYCLIFSTLSSTNGLPLPYEMCKVKGAKFGRQRIIIIIIMILILIIIIIIIIWSWIELCEWLAHIFCILHWYKRNDKHSIQTSIQLVSNLPDKQNRIHQKQNKWQKSKNLKEQKQW